MQQAARVSDYTAFLYEGVADRVRPDQAALHDAAEEGNRRLHHGPVWLGDCHRRQQRLEKAIFQHAVFGKAPTMQPFKKILFVSDPDGWGEGALARAARLAKETQASLAVVEVIEPLPHRLRFFFSLMLPQDPDDFAVQDCREELAQSVEPIRRQGVRVETRVLSGDPVQETTREVIRNGHDLVIVATESGSGMKGQFLRDVAVRLMRKCPCPIWASKGTQGEGSARILAAVDPDLGDERRYELAQRSWTWRFLCATRPKRVARDPCLDGRRGEVHRWSSVVG